MGSQVQERMIYALNKSSIECLDANLWSYTRLGKIDDLSGGDDAPFFVCPAHFLKTTWRRCRFLHRLWGG